MVRAIIDMLRYDVHGVLFSLPADPGYGMMVLIIWHYRKRDILAKKGTPPDRPIN